jgi:predicted nucleotidyltransferase component of viral defense system
MTNTATTKPELHEDTDFFRSALIYTAESTGFSPHLVEKDYYCSILLHFLFQSETPLVFKGGTCLSKVYAGFYRLSEDLDFAISVNENTSRPGRRSLIDPLKRQINDLPKTLPGMTFVEELVGHNQSTQYIGRLGYRSVLSGEPGTIKIEIGLREALLEAPEAADTHTLLQDPFARNEAIPLFKVRAISRQEAYAEKLRAALSRREPAIRDFYDIDHAVRKLKLDLRDQRLMNLLRRKLAVPGNERLDMTPVRRRALQAQLNAQLRPVLRPQDFDQFDLERAFRSVASVALRIKDNVQGRPKDKGREE